jgi:hypothetical protein
MSSIYSVKPGGQEEERTVDATDAR